MKTTTPIYAALDLHCNHSVLGSMDHDGNLLGQTRFGTDAGQLKEQIAALGSKHRRPVSGNSRPEAIAWPLERCSVGQARFA